MKRNFQAIVRTALRISEHALNGQFAYQEDITIKLLEKDLEELERWISGKWK